MHRDDLSVGKPQCHLGTAGQRFGSVHARRVGSQPAIQFVDSVAEDDEFVSTLYRFGGVAVIADHAPVVFDLDLEAIAALPQPVQLRGEVIPRCLGQPR